MTLLNDAMTILARAQKLAAFAQKYVQYAPRMACVHTVSCDTDTEESLPRVTFYASDLYQIGLIFGVAGWQKQLCSDWIEFVREVEGVTVYVYRVQLCEERFEGRQDVTPAEFERLARESMPLATVPLQQEAA
jgi:hypothetical protein